MKTTFTMKQLTLAMACAMALGVSSAHAQSKANYSDLQYLNDTRDVTWRNGSGGCWRSDHGPTPGYGECNPAPMAQNVAPAPAPYVAPVVVAAAPPQPVYERVTLDTNVLFDFDKSVLRQAGKDSLDSFVGRIQGIGAGSITAVGFADRFGTDGYNQALSERRVEAVKVYLVNKGVEPTWAVLSSAKGEMQPTTKAGECTGATATASTIACLQPDRHVFVEISGQRLKQ